jgi:general secretion pathway protein C
MNIACFDRAKIFPNDAVAFVRGLVLGLGLSLALASMGEEGVPSASNPETHTTAGHEPSAAVTPALKGTILSARSAEARVIITDASGHEQLYARGDEISPGASIVEIHRTFVVLRRNGRLEKIDFSRRSAEPLLEESAASTESGGTPPGNDPEALRTEMFTNPGLLLQLVGATTVVEGGHFVGYRVMAPQNPAFLESLGLKPDDVLTAVNGMSFSNTSDYGAKLFDSLSGTGKLTFTVRRGSQTLVVHD